MKKTFWFCFVALLIAITTIHAQHIPDTKTILRQRGDGKFQFFTGSPNVPVNNFVWDSVGQYINDFAIAYELRGAIFVNLRGVPLSQSRYQALRKYSAKRAAFRKNGLWGFLNPSGGEVIAARYNEALDFTDDVTAVKVQDKWFLIDNNGKTLKSLDIESISPFLDGVALVTKSGKKGYITTKGKMVFHDSGSQLNELDRQPSVYRTQAGVIPCPPNIDFESGNFTNWTCYTGETSVSTSLTNTITVNVSGPTFGRHTLIQRSPTSLLDMFGLFPTNPPDGSGYAIKLGNNEIGGQAERVRYVIKVPSNAEDYSITFQYAVVLENPDKETGQLEHEDWEQPRFTAKMQDATSGELLPCASFTYVASLVPGFLNSKVKSTSPQAAPIKYKPWSAVYVNLSKYAGRTLYFDLTTADCTKRGHFGYAYVDVVECGIAAKAQYQCTYPNITTLNGPPGFQSYTWYDKNFSTIVGTTKDVTLNPGPSSGSDFWVVVKPYNNIDCKTCDCRDTIRVKVAALLPTADAGPDKTICTSSPIILGSSPVSDYSYNWTPSAGLSNAFIANPTANVQSSISYKVTVTNQLGCTNSDSVNVTFVAKPQVLFTASRLRQCLINNSVSFTNSSTFNLGNLTYLWRFGDGQTSTAQNPVHNYSLPGTYKVTLIAYGITGCEDSVAQLITIDPTPSPSFSINSIDQCVVNNNFQFNNTSTIPLGSLTYAWTFGDGVTSTYSSPAHKYASAGIYTVKLIVTSANGCIDSLSKTVSIYPKPTANFSISQPVQCFENNQFTFANQSTISHPSSSYAWDFGDGQTSTLNSPTHSYNVAGSYRIRLHVKSGNSCDDTLSRQIIIHPNPLVSFRINTTVQCLRGNEFTLINDSKGNGLLYEWTWGDGMTSTDANPSHHYNTSGSYSVQLLATSDKGCQKNYTQLVIVHPNPKIAFNTGSNVILCKGEGKQLLASGAETYSWAPEQTLSCSSCPNPTATPSTSLTYYVNAANNFGCSDKDSIRVEVIQPFQVRVNSDTICISEFTTLRATGAARYLWSPAAGLNSTNASSPSASPTITTVYRVVGYDAHSCFTDTAYSTVTVGLYPTVNLGPNIVSSTGSVLTLANTTTNGPIINWRWAPSTYLSCTNCSQPEAAIMKDIDYRVMVTNIYGCTGEDSISIKATCDNGQVFIANAFTPDGDGTNDVFFVQGRGIAAIKSLRIFNRWGELLFERLNTPPNNPTYGWDGRIRGVPGPPDVFVYIVELVCTNGTPFFFKGNITILK